MNTSPIPVIALDGLPGEIKSISNRLQKLGCGVATSENPWNSTFDSLTNSLYEALLIAEKGRPAIIMGWTGVRIKAQGEKVRKDSVARLLYRLTKRHGVHVVSINDQGNSLEPWELLAAGYLTRKESPSWARGLQYESFSGDPRPDVLLVGDRHNHKVTAPFPWPFHQHQASSLWLDKRLKAIGVGRPGESPTIGFANVNDPDGKEILTHILDDGWGDRIVALGNEARDTLKRLKMNISAVVPHPSYSMRFLNGVPYEYENQLYKALGL